MSMFNQPNKSEYNVAIFESQSKSAFSEENALKVLIHFILRLINELTSRL